MTRGPRSSAACLTASRRLSVPPRFVRPGPARSLEAAVGIGLRGQVIDHLGLLPAEHSHQVGFVVLDEIENVRAGPRG